MFIPYTNEKFIFTGVWQENENGEIINYKTASFFEIGFTGKSITLCWYCPIVGWYIFLV